MVIRGRAEDSMVGGQWLINDRWPGDCLDEMAFETRQSYLMIRDGRRQPSRESQSEMRPNTRLGDLGRDNAHAE